MHTTSSFCTRLSKHVLLDPFCEISNQSCHSDGHYIETFAYKFHQLIEKNITSVPIRRNTCATIARRAHRHLRRARPTATGEAAPAGSAGRHTCSGADRAAFGRWLELSVVTGYYTTGYTVISFFRWEKYMSFYSIKYENKYLPRMLIFPIIFLKFFFN